MILTHSRKRIICAIAAVLSISAVAVRARFRGRAIQLSACKHLE